MRKQDLIQMDVGRVYFVMRDDVVTPNTLTLTFTLK
jgi:hypothetical protein